MGDRLKGKVAIVTGAGSVGPGIGNGKATAMLFAREGARVLLVDYSLEAAEETHRLIDEEGGTSLTFRADVSRSDDCAAMVEECIRAFGRVDVLHNNVGIEIPGGIEETSEDDWDRTLNVNLKSVFPDLQAHAPAHGRGRAAAPSSTSRRSTASGRSRPSPVRTAPPRPG